MLINFFAILPFAMVQSQELKLALIEAYYENGRSPTLVRRKIMSPGSKWLLIAPKLSSEQIKRVMSQLTTNYSLKNASPPGRSRSAITDKNLAMIRRKLEVSPRRSVSSLSKELDISETSTFMTALKRKGVYKRTIFQLDGAPTHCSKVAIEWLTEKFGDKKAHFKEFKLPVATLQLRS